MRQETEFEVKLSPLRVWGMLADLRSYAEWHPRYVFSGEPELGERVDFSFLALRDRRVRSDVLITQLQKPHCIAWQLNVGKFVACFEEQYEIAGAGTGSRVRHSIEWRGVTNFFFRRTAKNFAAFLNAYDAAFLVQAKRVARSSPVGNRHNRRSAQAVQARRAAND